MSEKKNKNNKGKKTARLSKNGKIFIFSVSAMIVIAVAATSIYKTVKRNRVERSVNIAFYGLPEEYCTLLQEYIPKEEKINLKCDILSEGALDLAAIKTKYDLLFTWKGEVTSALEASSEQIPERILDVLPNSLKNKKCVPILLDHCELAYSKDVVIKTGKDIPNSYQTFLNYLNDATQYVFSPFFCNGADDRILTAFVGALVLANGGEEAYTQLIEELKKGIPLENLLDQKLSGSKQTTDLTLRFILDTLKTWPKQGYTHPAWFNAMGNDLLYFSQDKQIGVFFTFLKDHRNIPYDVISQYESFVVPPTSSSLKYGIVAPALSAMLISENSNAKRYLAEFFTQEAQESLSNKTKLAPVHSRAQAYDRQADDVRFWAASCPAGALPDLALAVYQRNPQGLKDFADSIRNYIR